MFPPPLPFSWYQNFPLYSYIYWTARVIQARILWVCIQSDRQSGTAAVFFKRKPSKKTKHFVYFQGNRPGCQRAGAEQKKIHIIVWPGENDTRVYRIIINRYFLYHFCFLIPSLIVLETLGIQPKNCCFCCCRPTIFFFF